MTVEQGASEPSYTHVSNIPFHSFDAEDPLDRKLDEIYANAGWFTGSELRWGLLYPVNDDGWGSDPHARVSGNDWQADFFAANTIPDFSSEDVDDLVPYNSCLVSVLTGTSDSLDAARDFGRAAVREAASLLMATTQIVAGQQITWEGAFTFRDDGLISATNIRRLLRLATVDMKSIQRRMDRLKASDTVNTRPALSLARHWYLKAWETPNTLDRFIGLWLTAAALYEPHRPPLGSPDRERSGMRSYLVDLTNRTGLSPLIRDDVRDRLFDAYILRNNVFHEGDFRSVGYGDTAALERAVSICIRQEAGLTAP